MPIQINLLAEQQAAEEARRRDPVKRALWVGGSLVGLMVLWIVLLQIALGRAGSVLSRYETQLQASDENSKEARARWAESNEIESRLASLQRYTTNRFFYALLLDAMQQIMVSDVRVVQLQTAHSYTTNAEATFKTNFVFPLAMSKSWLFWRSQHSTTDVLSLVSNRLEVITNQVEALKAPVALETKISVVTNTGVAPARVEIRKPATATEHVALTIRARDYSASLGKQVDEFFNAITAHPYFAQRLRQGEGEGIRLKERPIQPEFDSPDSASSSRPFIPFTIECRYREVVRVNE
jgi:hypothetical protein